MSASITIYSTPTCGFCHMAKAYFKSLKLEYVDHDISTDQQALQQVLETTGQAAVPVIDILGIVIIGFDRPQIDAALQSKKLL